MKRVILVSLFSHFWLRHVPASRWRRMRRNHCVAYEQTSVAIKTAVCSVRCLDMAVILVEALLEFRSRDSLPCPIRMGKRFGADFSLTSWCIAVIVVVLTAMMIRGRGQPRHHVVSARGSPGMLPRSLTPPSQSQSEACNFLCRLCTCNSSRKYCTSPVFAAW
jgi:hypothetical protein